MTTLKNHTLLYDTDCPLCAAYTKGFIRAGIMEETGRLSYEKGIAQYSDLLDTDRARNEIALVNTDNGKVLYGIDSMNYIITHKFPLLKPVLNNAAILFILRKFYSFISFNRKVIAASASYTRQTCVPDFHLSYRILYLVLSGIFTSTILLSYSSLLKGIVPPSNLVREYVICFGQIAFQGSILLVIKTGKENLFDYLGNMMTVSLIGGLLLLPILILNHYISLPAYLCLAWFFAVVCFMFLQHQKRVRYIHAPVWLSYTWVLYRCIVLLLIL
jgi:predicted DCC family thiol-disulfide oxidoreductase YuxK